MTRIVIPYAPRIQFLPLHERTQRWAVVVAHRRAGKTVACINELIKHALTCPLPNPRFAYLAPFRSQAKDTCWTYVKEFTHSVPHININESDLRVDLPNGGRIRLYGTDNFESLRGIYLDGVIFDEFADMDPRSWTEVIRPTLSDRSGFAIFIGTPKGHNHFSDLWEKADPDWFKLMLKASDTGLLPETELADARKMMSEDQYNAEFECSFEASVQGSYYGREMQALIANGRVTGVPWEPRLPVFTAWDLGSRDSTAIWFAQVYGKETRLIDFYQHNGVGLDHYVNVLHSKGYVYGDHFLPHDAQVREMGSGRTRLEMLRSLGINGRVLPMQKIADGINAVRNLLPGCWFDAEKCASGVDALRNYRKEWDPRYKIFDNKPRHDWTSHASDAFRYLAEGAPTNDVEWSKPINYPKRSYV